MATHSNILAWRIPLTEKPGGLQSMGSQRVRHDWSDLAVYTIDHVYLSIPVFQFILFPPLPRWCSYICSLPLCLYFCFLSQGCVFFWRLFRNVWPFVCPNFSRLPAFPGPHPSIIFKVNSGWYYFLMYCHSNWTFLPPFSTFRTCDYFAPVYITQGNLPILKAI